MNAIRIGSRESRAGEEHGRAVVDSAQQKCQSDTSGRPLSCQTHPLSQPEHKQNCQLYGHERQSLYTMSLKDAKEHIREEAAEESRRDEEQQARIEQRLRKWKIGTVCLGIALLASVGAVVPFLYGNPLHDQWDAIGKKILLLSMCFLAVFMYVAATTYNLWSYLRAMKHVHQTFAPPR